MTVPYTLLQVVLVPIFFAAVCYLAAPRLGKKVGWLAFVSLVYPILLLLADGAQLWTGGSPITETYKWAPSLGLSFGFLADGLSLPVALLVDLVLAASTIYAMPYMEKRIQALGLEKGGNQYGLYYMTYLLLCSGLAGIALSTNLIELYLFLELVLIPTFVIITLYGYVEKEKVGMIYIIWNQIGAFIFLGGIAAAYVATGSFNISALGSLNQTCSLGICSPAPTIAFWVAGLVLVGWLVKMAVFGVHMWLPITEAEPPTAFAPTMAIVSGIGTYVIVRVLIQQMPDVFSAFSLPLMAWAVVTMLYGGAVSMVQTDVKYLFAWSTMSQNAYSILAIASYSVLGVAGGVFYFVSHILGKFVLFSIAGVLVVQTGTRDMKKMGGLAAKMPFTASLFLLGAFILTAVPPTSGFQAEWIMFAGIFGVGASGPPGYMAVAVIGIIATLFTVFYTLWPMRRIFFGAVPEAMSNVKDAPLTMTLPLFAIVVVSIVIGIYPDLVTKFLIPFANGLPIRGTLPG